jgi:error-prone DNA polymerase
VLTEGRLDELVPIQNAAMEDRTVIEWDKDDLDVLKIYKVDVLGLGMLTCLRKSFDLIERHYGERAHLGMDPKDPAVYDMLCQADSVGVFQVESRAQMSMLPRLRPREYYDLVIEVAIVRPGPIQGGMVHPYLKNREKDHSEIHYPGKLRGILERTRGVPLFQEQAMQIAIDAAGFSPAKADKLRRAMATFRRSGTIHKLKDDFIQGMVGNGYEPMFAERCFKQIEGFGEYGFPESHAASFAILVYDSSWVKHYYPEVFCAALLNSQPMGFYAPAQLVRDAREHGVEVRPPDINASDWDCTLEPVSESSSASSPSYSSPPLGGEARRGGFESSCNPLSPPLPRAGERSPIRERRLKSNRCALRLGLRQVTGVAEDDMKRLVERRGAQPYRDPVDLWRRSGLGKRQIIALARADAFASLGLSRRDVLWAVRGLSDAALPLLDGPQELRDLEPSVQLPALTLGEQVVDDYAAISMTLRAHPLALLRARLTERDIAPTAVLKECSNGDVFTLAGLVLVRQRPGTASGVVFVTIEDEHGIANLVVWPGVFERYRRIVMGARLLGVRGRIQREGLVIHLVAEALWDWSADLDAISEIDDFRLAHGRGDQAHSSSPDQREQPKPKPVKPPVRKRGYDRSQIALDRPRIKIASRDFH